ncbi:MAG: 1-acyl-sn-glycerol-3-phosphate acyltransferase [Bacteroidales bacterium]|jgi:1-acyl-sn-glycerol-3-phosphate acyltransferase|nr:1-acyl-sn-glycerol-3-phosphate acyltransferase [Bacteroidales bacterium]
MLSTFLFKYVYRLKPIDYPEPGGTIPKSVLMMAPHTSIMDFVIGLSAMKYYDLHAKTIIKKEFFFFPLGGLLKKLGGIPVDRKRVRNFVSFAANTIKEHDRITLIICPEGTRKRTDKWKRGFYQIAMEAGVPISLGYIDYHTRTCGIMSIFEPTGDYEKDLEEIQKQYYGLQGYKKGQFNLEDKPHAHPEWFNL